MMPQVNIVIPSIGTNRYIIDLVQQIVEMDDDIVRNVLVLDNGMPQQTSDDCKMFPGVTVIDSPTMGIYDLWNRGVKTSLAINPRDYIAILNDDLVIIDPSQPFFTSLVEPMDCHDDIWATCANYDGRQAEDYYFKWDTFPGTRKDNGFAGFCFAVNGDAYVNGKMPLFDPSYSCWYGDDDFVVEIYKKGKKTAMAIDARIDHINGGSNSFGDRSRLVNEENAKDTQHYYAKHHPHLLSKG